MIEVGKEYKLKKIDLPIMNNDTSLYRILAKDGDYVHCINLDTNEVFDFMTDFFIDPTHPEDDVYKDITVAEGLNCVVKPQSDFLLDLLEEGGCGCVACSSGCSCANTAAAAATGQTGNGTTSVTNAMTTVYGNPVQGKSIKKKKKKKKNETYEDEQSQYELFDRALELRDKFYNDNEMATKTEAMINYVDILESIKRNGLIDSYVIYAKNKDIDELSLDLLESTDDNYIISDTVAKRLKRLGFIWANTNECVYKREGNYKHLIKFDNQDQTIKYKVFNGDSVLEEQLYKLDDKSDVNKIFDDIQNKVEGLE